MKTDNEKALEKFLNAAETKLGGAKNLRSAADVAQRTYNNWLHGTEPRFWGMIAIAKAAGLSLDEAFLHRPKSADVDIPGEYIIRCVEAVEAFTHEKGLTFKTPADKIAVIRALAETTYDPTSMDETVDIAGDNAKWLRAIAR